MDSMHTVNDNITFKVKKGNVKKTIPGSKKDILIKVNPMVI